MKNFVRKVVRSAGYDIIKARPVLIDFMNDRGIDQVIDVGANVGQFARQLRRRGYTGAILSLEPVSKVFQQLNANCSSDPKWKGLNLAAGDKDGSQEIQISENTEFSSLNKTTAAAEQFDPQARQVATEVIKVARLDTLLADLTGNILLKIDTQGYESSVLNGATALLARTSLVQLELPSLHLYENVWSMADAMKRMEGLGFALLQMQAINYLKKGQVVPIDFDCLFGRPQS